MMKPGIGRVRAWARVVALALALGTTPILGTGAAGQILLGKSASPLEQYAARELQRYFYQLFGNRLAIETAMPGSHPSGLAFILGRRETNPLIEQFAAEGQLRLSPADPGPQGYVLKTITRPLDTRPLDTRPLDTRPLDTRPLDTRPRLRLVVIAGSDEVGCLYGVYGLLQDYYGVGFYLGGDVLPDKHAPGAAALWPPALARLDERHRPAVAIRGLLPWTNFPQSATSYSWEDWQFILDQMAKMRLNFLHIHNYNGECGHNEMFHNVIHNGVTPRVWMATARSGHAWGGRPGWDPNHYRFGASDLFDDYDFGADCALHNETLSNEQAFRKGVSEFQKVIAYAHTRAIKIGLGLDIDILPPELSKAKADDPQLIAHRIGQVITDYPDLDYLLCFQSESIFTDKPRYQVWHNVFEGFYQALKQRAPQIRIAVAGWGISAEDVAHLPPEVICAPISKYSAGCENGSIYGQREYWGCPWLERDGGSSEYYYPYNLHLSQTIQAWQSRAPNMKGFYCLTWRLTDAIDPKLAYIAKAPWDDAGKYTSSEAVYREYAEQCYGHAAARAITPIINQNEPFATDWGECMPTPPFAEPGTAAGYLLNISTFNVHKAGQASRPPLVAANSALQHGTKTAPCSEGGLCVGFIEHGHWLRFDDVDFGTAADTFEARGAAAGQGGEIELRLEALEGPLLGACTVENTGDWQTWVTRKITIPTTSGKHTLYLKFRARNISKTEFAKAVQQLKVIDDCIAQAEFPAQKARLQLLRCRIAAARDHIELNQRFNSYAWADLPGAMESWAQNFVGRVTDISSLGNVVSSQNRFVQLNYVKKENALRQALALPPPTDVEARGTAKGAIITWTTAEDRKPKTENRPQPVVGFNVYRAEPEAGLRLPTPKKLNSHPLPRSATTCTDTASGQFRYTVTALAADGAESPPSVPVCCDAGLADHTPPRIIVLSPPTSAPENSPVWIKARLFDSRAYSTLSATLYYRVPGTGGWKTLPMTRRVKAVFTAQIPARAVTASGLEYYLQATDGDNTAVFPAGAPASPLSLATYPVSDSDAPTPPKTLLVQGRDLAWTPAPGAFWYRVYRSHRPKFAPGPDTILTYVEQATTAFRDDGFDLTGRPLTGTWYYRITAVDKTGHETAPTKPAAINYNAQSP